MKKFVAIVLSLPIVAFNVECENKNFRELLNDSLECLKDFEKDYSYASLERSLKGELPFYAITATRIHDTGEPLFLDEVATVLACICLICGSDKNYVIQTLTQRLDQVKKFYIEKFKKLYAWLSLFPSSKLPNSRSNLSPFNARHVDFMLANIKNFALPTNCVSPNIDIGKEIETIFTKRAEKLLNSVNSITCTYKNIKTNWKFCVFNEMFFSKTIPVSRDYITNINNLLDEDYTLFHINFLYHETRPAVLEKREVLRIKNQLGSVGENNKSRFSCSVGDLNAYIDYINKCCVGKNNMNYIINMSEIVWEKQPICFYKKSSYCHENDTLLQQGYIYDVGDGNDHKYLQLPSRCNKMADVVLNNISTEICYDLWSGVRRQNNWQNNNGPKSRLHILVSNWVSLYDNLLNFPAWGALVVHVDPILLNENVFSLRSGIHPNVDPVFALTKSFNSPHSPLLLKGWQSVYDERLKSLFDISKLIKNNPVESIRLNFNQSKYIIQLYDLRDALLRMKRGY